MRRSALWCRRMCFPISTAVFVEAQKKIMSFQDPRTVGSPFETANRSRWNAIITVLCSDVKHRWCIHPRFLPFLITARLTTRSYEYVNFLPAASPSSSGGPHASQACTFRAIMARPTCADGCLRAAGHNGDIVLAILASQCEPRAGWFNYTIIHKLD